MPILSVKISGKKDQKTTNELSKMLLSLTCEVLRKKREVTAITIEYIDHDSWIIAGKPLTEYNKNSFYFDIKITDETNTKDEKEKYISEVFKGFENIIGPIHEESYIYVQDVRAASYGYGGKTQEYRYHMAPKKT